MSMDKPVGKRIGAGVNNKATKHGGKPIGRRQPLLKRNDGDISRLRETLGSTNENGRKWLGESVKSVESVE